MFIYFDLVTLPQLYTVLESLNALVRKIARFADLQLALINCQDKDGVQLVAESLNSYPCYFDSGVFLRRLGKSVISQYPYCFLFDRQGRLKHEGFCLDRKLWDAL